MNSAFVFPPDYYEICSSNNKQKRENWFCNKPLSPIKVVPCRIDSLQRQRTLEMENDMSHPGQTDDDSNDIDYCLSDTSTETSSSSPQICSTPESLSSPENMEVDKINNHDTDQGLDIDINAATLCVVNKSVHDNLSPTISTKQITCNTKKSVFCFYCETYVLHFPRHLSRNHTTEIEVQKIMSLNPRSKKRKELLYSLRKKGNYLTSNEIIKPVRKGDDKSRYLPCIHCMGFYSAKNLWRHRKKCSENPMQGSSGKNSQGDAQNYMIRHLRVDALLKTDVFPRMRADHISLVAKKDLLICTFASRYLKIHREKHFIPVASRKMRELARLLIEVKKIKPTVSDLGSCLRAKFYDTLVSATKSAAKYDTEKQTFKSPTFALQMGTTLKQCCDIALVHSLKNSDNIPSIQSAQSEAEIKTLIQLIDGNWRFDVSSQAASDLSLQKWNKITIVPLASDLKLLKDYLVGEGRAALSKLEENKNDVGAYITLLETIYCRLLLLNRRRPGELQRINIDTYKAAVSNENPQGYEEFSEAITETEKMLMNNFKRMVIRGKRGKGVPVLISTDVQEHLETILSCRNLMTKNKAHPYLFGNPNTGEPIVGYKVLRKYATQCGAVNPGALTCTRLRKHLATLTQLFNMSENDMEQLASFMGHTLGIHRSSYRLPDDIYQTARISKLLILMENGKAGRFKGKTLDDIDVNFDENLMEAEALKEVDELIPLDVDCGNSLEQNKSLEAGVDVLEGHKDKSSGVECGNEKMGTAAMRKKRILVPWTEQQKKVVLAYFRNHIKERRPPKRTECEDLISKFPELLKNKNWLKIKVFVQNKYRT